MAATTRGGGEFDARRDRALVRAGYRVLRVEAALFMPDLATVAAMVRAAIEELRRGASG